MSPVSLPVSITRPPDRLSIPRQSCQHLILHPKGQINGLHSFPGHRDTLLSSQTSYARLQFSLPSCGGYSTTLRPIQCPLSEAEIFQIWNPDVSSQIRLISATKTPGFMASFVAATAAGCHCHFPLFPGHGSKIEHPGKSDEPVNVTADIHQTYSPF